VVDTVLAEPSGEASDTPSVRIIAIATHSRNFNRKCAQALAAAAIAVPGPRVCKARHADWLRTIRLQMNAGKAIRVPWTVPRRSGLEETILGAVRQ